MSQHDDDSDPLYPDGTAPPRWLLDQEREYERIQAGNQTPSAAPSVPGPDPSNPAHPQHLEWRRQQLSAQTMAAPPPLDDSDGQDDTGYIAPITGPGRYGLDEDEYGDQWQDHSPAPSHNPPPAADANFFDSSAVVSTAGLSEKRVRKVEKFTRRQHRNILVRHKVALTVVAVLLALLSLGAYSMVKPFLSAGFGVVSALDHVAAGVGHFPATVYGAFRQDSKVYSVHKPVELHIDKNYLALVATRIEDNFVVEHDVKSNTPGLSWITNAVSHHTARFVGTAHMTLGIDPSKLANTVQADANSKTHVLTIAHLPQPTASEGDVTLDTGKVTNVSVGVFQKFTNFVNNHQEALQPLLAKAKSEVFTAVTKGKDSPQNYSTAESHIRLGLADIYSFGRSGKPWRIVVLHWDPPKQ